MSLDAALLIKPFHSLRKCLAPDFEATSPEQVHELRTRARGLETVLTALQFKRGKDTERLSKAVASIRKRAGTVRDMDVLLRFAASLSVEEEDACLLELLARLGVQREKAARKLGLLIEDTRKETNRELKRFEHYLDKHSADVKQRDSRKKTWEAEGSESAQGTLRVLSEWPKLNARNLHPFRLQVKQLLVLLKLDKSSKATLLSQLAMTKDAAGEWHDWKTLSKIAAKVLDHSACPIRKRIDAMVKEKFAHAVAVAGRLREQFPAS